MRRKPVTKPDPFRYCTPLERACAELLTGAAEPLTLEEVHAAVKDVKDVGSEWGPWPLITVRDCVLAALVSAEIAVQTADGRWAAAS